MQATKQRPLELAKERVRKATDNLREVTRWSVEGRRIEGLFQREGRNPHLVKRWLVAQGYDPKSIDLVLAYFAQRLADGEKFGYNRKGVSLLSKAIHDKLDEITQIEDAHESVAFGQKYLPTTRRLNTGLMTVLFSLILFLVFVRLMVNWKEVMWLSKHLVLSLMAFMSQVF